MGALTEFGLFGFGVNDDAPVTSTIEGVTEPKDKAGMQCPRKQIL